MNLLCGSQSYGRNRGNYHVILVVLLLLLISLLRPVSTTATANIATAIVLLFV